MSKLLVGSICLTDISNLLKEGKISADVSKKNGKKYLSVAVWVNDKIDQYGNIASISHRNGKDSEKFYIGNLKEPVSRAHVEQAAPSQHTNDDTIPF